MTGPETEVTKAQIAKRIEQIMASAEGCGHALNYGEPPRTRYDRETGEPYITEMGLARLECPDAKMRAIWEAWEMLPRIAFLLNQELHAQETQS